MRLLVVSALVKLGRPHALSRYPQKRERQLRKQLPKPDGRRKRI